MRRPLQAILYGGFRDEVNIGFVYHENRTVTCRVDQILNDSRGEETARRVIGGTGENNLNPRIRGKRRPKGRRIGQPTVCFPGRQTHHAHARGFGRHRIHAVGRREVEHGVLSRRTEGAYEKINPFVPAARHDDSCGIHSRIGGITPNDFFGLRFRIAVETRQDVVR